MIKPNETKTWASGTAFNISELAVGIQLFSVWIHLPFLNISMCINKMKWPSRIKRAELGSLGSLGRPRGLGVCTGLSHGDTSGPAPSLPPELTSFDRLKTGRGFRRAGELINNDKKGKDATRGNRLRTDPVVSEEGLMSLGGFSQPLSCT